MRVHIQGHGVSVRELDTCHISQGRHILFMAPKKKRKPNQTRRFVGFFSLNGPPRTNGERNGMEQLPFDRLPTARAQKLSASYVIHWQTR